MTPFDIISWCASILMIMFTVTVIIYCVSLCFGFFFNVLDDREDAQRERNYEFFKKHGKWPDQIKGL